MTNKNFTPTNDGFYGSFGGAFVPDILQNNINKLKAAYFHLSKTDEFKAELRTLLRDYVGRPSPLYFSQSLSEMYGVKVYLKREDLNFTGAHKINNTLGQILLARYMGCKKIIAETGAGQHGVATATVCALLGMECRIYMGATDINRQRPNVDKMQLLGAEVVAVTAGSGTLSDAVDAALQSWCEHPSDYFYLLGSAVGPHPYPQMVAEFQSVISEEIAAQLMQSERRDAPDAVIACVGGGSNAAGAFYHFIDNPAVRLVAAEAAGHGIASGFTAASMTLGREIVLHGARTLVITDSDGKAAQPYSISAGLDYPGVGPLLASMAVEGRIEVVAITDKQAVGSAIDMIKREGIFPAIESAHALAALPQVASTLSNGSIVVINLSGRGDKDMELYLSQN